MRKRGIKREKENNKDEEIERNRNRKKCWEEK